jgi:hypothetical protein
MKLWSLFTAIILSATACKAQEKNTTQDQEAAYTKTILSRAEKIVSTLQIKDDAKAALVTQIIANQYRSLNALHTERDLRLKEAKARLTDKEAFEKEKKSVEESSTAKIDVLHKAYLSSLSAHLNPGQVDQVKDGMTYGVVPITYKGYLEMIPTLKEEEKKQIMIWLVEAREHAMDGESSEMKHWWFGKYKGRINNYLSAQGYDLQKERKEWEQRQKAAKDQKQASHH